MKGISTSKIDILHSTFVIIFDFTFCTAPTLKGVGFFANQK
jgi:hypothetical protein